MNIIKWLFKMRKKVTKHLKRDIKGYKHEIKEDKELIKELKIKKKPVKKKVLKKNLPSKGGEKERKSQMTKKITIGKGMKVPIGKASKMKKRPGGSNVGEYKNVSKKDFAGKAGGSPSGSYPINTLARAKSAIKLAHNASNPAGIRRAVYEKYPSLKKRKK